MARPERFELPTTWLEPMAGAEPLSCPIPGTATAGHVAAVDLPTADAAVRLIEVEYEELPVVSDPLAAIQEGAPQLFDHLPTTSHDHAVQRVLTA